MSNIASYLKVFTVQSLVRGSLGWRKFNELKNCIGLYSIFLFRICKWWPKSRGRERNAEIDLN